MLQIAKQALRAGLRKLGYDLVAAGQAPQSEFPPDFEPEAQELCRTVRPYTMTSPERIYALRQAVQYVIQAAIPGDIVECGVWRGGSMMAVARTLLQLGVRDRALHLFDTFDGMPPPSGEDVTFKGEAASDLMAVTEKETATVWAYSGLEAVKRNLASIGYPPDRTHFIPGKVEDTIPQGAPPQIALLRLDTDWYESTYHELVHLYPRVSPGGVIIIDDYGHWTGARKAVDQYLAEQKLTVLLHRIDYTGRAFLKPQN